jgi:hypothetical protein
MSDSGHNPFIEQVRAFWSVVGDFLGEQCTDATT